MRIRELEPGDIMPTPEGPAVFIMMHTPHPLYANEGLVLVVWWLTWSQEWSFDALSSNMELVDVPINNPGDRKESLLLAFHHGQRTRA